MILWFAAECCCSVMIRRQAEHMYHTHSAVTLVVAHPFIFKALAVCPQSPSWPWNLTASPPSCHHDIITYQSRTFCSIGTTQMHSLKLPLPCRMAYWRIIGKLSFLWHFTNYIKQSFSGGYLYTEYKHKGTVRKKKQNTTRVTYNQSYGYE